MKSSLFITGSSGFIASNLLRALDIERYKNVYCLSRHESEILKQLSGYENFKFIKGSIFDSGLYQEYLASSETVVHLAAATGKAGREEYFRINADGTGYLIERCKQSGVKKFIFVSSIAVKFSEVSEYYYAQSKIKAEDIVKNSGINYSIVRPTIVIGKESPVLLNLAKLAKMSVIPIFGDGKTRIQPIYVEDLVKCLLYIVDENIFANETYDLGGPEVITIEDFIKRIHMVSFKKEPRLIHVPIGILILLFSFIEKFLYSLLPFNVGQLSSFRFDGTAEENRIFLDCSAKMKNVNEMLEMVIDNE